MGDGAKSYGRWCFAVNKIIIFQLFSVLLIYQNATTHQGTFSTSTGASHHPSVTRPRTSPPPPPPKPSSAPPHSTNQMNRMASQNGFSNGQSSQQHQHSRDPPPVPRKPRVGQVTAEPPPPISMVDVKGRSPPAASKDSRDKKKTISSIFKKKK